MTTTLSLAIILVGTLGQVVFGFGGGLIAIPPLSLVLGVQNAVTSALVLQLVTGLLLWRIRKDIQWSFLKPMIGGLVVGTVGGIYLLSHANEDFLRVFLALFIVTYLIKSQFFDDVSFPSLKRPGGGLVMGTLAGLLQGLIGCGGPPMVIYLLETVEHKLVMRAGLLFLLFVSNCLRVPLSINAGLFNSEVIRLSLAAIPCFLLAIFLGQRLHHSMAEAHYHLAIRIVLSISAISLILKSL